MADKTTFTEIEDKLSLCDILDLHEALDIQEELNAIMNKPRTK